MKNLMATLVLLAAVASATGIAVYRMTGEPDVRAAAAKRDALEWLRTDFNLSDAQFAVIKKLHESYSTVCEEHCRAIMEASEARTTLKARPAADSAAIAAADRRVEELRIVCETAIASHCRQVAAEMSPEAGRRYLALVLPKIRDFDHRAPPDLGLNGHVHH